MIELKQIREKLEESLNPSGSNYVFKIFSDVADFQKGYRPHRSNDLIRPINGIIEPDLPNILAIKNLQVMTQGVTIHFVFDMDLLEKDANGNYIEVDNLKSFLYQWASGINAIPQAWTDENDITFEVTPTITGITNGLAVKISPVGDMLPVDLSISFAVVEAGINSNTFDFCLNGENLFTSSVNISRTREAETNMGAGKTATKTAVQTNGISFAIKTPLLNTTQIKGVLTDILNGGQNYAQILEVKNSSIGVQKFYFVTFGDDDAGFEPAKNVGVSFNLVEISPLIAKFGDNWTKGTAVYDGEHTANVNVTVTGKKAICFIWDSAPSVIDYRLVPANTTVLNFDSEQAANTGYKYMLLTEA